MHATRVEIPVDVERPYVVHVGPGVLDDAADEFATEEQACILSDPRVAHLYGDRLYGHPDQLFCVQEGEAAKDFTHLQRVLDFLVAERLDRGAALWNLGGGVVCDLGGLAASLYMRGIRCVHCPTTLLAQIDAAVGGKTAVNLSAGKNLAGTFHQPSAVYADTELLASLDESDYRSGLGEVVKYGLIEGGELRERLARSTDVLLARDAGALTPIVADCVRVKARIVSADPLEGGARKQLNLGHTFGHAIEQVAGFGRVPHGVAVGVGLVLALECSRELGVLRDPGLIASTVELLTALGLPTSLSELGVELAPEALLAAMGSDKKQAAGRARLVLVAGAGQLEIDVEPTPDYLAAFWHRRAETAS